MTVTSDSYPEAPAGLLVPPAAAVGFVVSVGIGALTPQYCWWALSILVIGCCLTTTVGSVRPALVIAGIWALCADGFVVHRYGRLVPVEMGDLGWLVAFLAAGLLGAWWRLPRPLIRRRVDAALHIPTRQERSGTSAL